MVVKLPKVIIFDFDGTIVDSAPIVCLILNNMRGQRGLEPLGFDELKPYLSKGGVDMISYALEVSAVEAEALLDEFRDRYVSFRTPADSLYPNVKEMLIALRATGAYICICTNKPRKLVEKIIDEMGLQSFFHFINAGGDMLEKKPHASNIQACLDFTAVSPAEAILVGDSTVDQNCAINANISFYFFSSGYDDGVDISKAKFIFQNHSELASHFSI